MWRDDAYLLDMLIAAEKIARFTTGVTFDKFASDDVLQNALLHLITVIGEAASRVSSETRTAHPEIEWGQIIGMRHRVVHDYFRIDLDVVWDSVRSDVPELIKKLQPLIPPERP